MKTSNIQQGRAHPEAIIRGWVSNRRAGSTGVTVIGGGTEANGITQIIVVGGTVTDNGDGTVTITVDAANTPIVADISNPPTQTELETAIGSGPAAVSGQAYIVTDSDTGLTYLVWSSGETFTFVPMVETGSNLATIATARGIFSDFTPQTGAAAYDATSGKLFWTYINASGDACVSSWDGSTLVNFTLHAALDPGDLHAQPSILIRSSDRKILVFYSAHNDNNMYLRISSSAASVSAFAAEVDLDASIGGTQYTYCVAHELTDAIYLFVRTHPGGALHAGADWAYSKSTNNGATWSAKVDVMTNASHGIYWQPSKTAADRVDFLATDLAPFDEAGGSMFHMYMIGGTFYETDGTEITATKPFDCSALTEVWTSDGVLSGDPGIVVLNGDNSPRVAFREFEDTSPEDCRYYWAKWDAVNGWDAQEIAAAGSGSQRGTLSLTDDSTVWYTKDDGSSIAQVHRITTPDDGTTWLDRQITDAADEQSRLATVHNAGDLAVLWLDGYVNDTTNADFTAASFVPVGGADAQRVVVIDGTALGEAIFQRTTGGDWQGSLDLGGSWENLGGTGVVYGTPAIVLGTVAAAGSTDEAIRRDSTIVAFDATVPVTQAFGDAAATGAAAKAARRDHVHGMPSSPVTESAILALVPAHVHVVGETHFSDGAATTYTLDESFEPGSVEAFNTTTLAYLTVTETQPDQATVSAAGSSGDKITFSYAGSLA